MTPELHRPVVVAGIGPAGVEMEVVATAAECAAVAARLEVPAILELACRFRLRRVAEGVAAEGRLRARLVRTCVVSLEDFEDVVGEEFVLRFVPAGTESEEIDPEAEDEVPYSGGAIDLGEAAVQQLALALDPYPRRPGAELPGEAPGDAPAMPSRH
jgi:hypothetical protein